MENFQSLFQPVLHRIVEAQRAEEGQPARALVVLQLVHVELYAHEVPLRFEPHVVQEVDEVLGVVLFGFVHFEAVWNVVEVGSWQRANEAGVFDVVVQAVAFFSQGLEVLDDDTEHDVNCNDIDEDEV